MITIYVPTEDCNVKTSFEALLRRHMPYPFAVRYSNTWMVRQDSNVVTPENMQYVNDLCVTAYQSIKLRVIDDSSYDDTAGLYSTFIERLH